MTDPGFESSHTTTFPEILRGLGVSLVISTYQSGRVIVVRADGDVLNTHFRMFESPMGLAVAGDRLVIGTRRMIWDYRDQPAVARRIDPPGKHDACFMPRGLHVTGDVRIHEVALIGDEIWFANTAFSCLATIDHESSFVPRWRPPFVSALTPEDRCHLNGMAVVDGTIRYVTALGGTDTANGWRDDKVRGGVLVDVASGEVVVRGLCMPHSPRRHTDQLWLLESGRGTLATVDVDRGTTNIVATLPGFTRGLAFAGPFAFVGLSQVRETMFSGLPIVDRDDRACGVWVVDVRIGEIVAFLRFEGSVEEVFDVQTVPRRFPELAEFDADIVATSFVLPDAALADVPEALRTSDAARS